MNRAAFTEHSSRAAETGKKQYTREAILSASPGKLLTMLYDRLLLDLHRAQEAQAAQHWDEASQQLLHAQQIIAELRSSLQQGQWQGAAQLQSIYSFVTQELVAANTGRDITKTQECIRVLEPLRQTWHEALNLAGSPGGAAHPHRSAAETPSGSGGMLGVG